MPSLLRAARVITPDEEFTPGWALLRDGRIVSAGAGAGPPGIPATDLGPLTLAPGFVDVHVHGGGGFPLITTRAEDVSNYARWVASHGVTSFLATVCAETVAAGRDCAEMISGLAPESAAAAEILGVNLEGPFVSPARLGALPTAWATTPDLSVFNELLTAARGKLRLMTIAPEPEGALEVIAAAVNSGVRVSVGHSDAGYEAAIKGFQAGASHVTHAFNAMRPMHHRDPGIVGAALQSEGVTVELIADGAHLHPATVDLLVRAFGPDRVALVTDGATPAGLASGTFRIGRLEAQLSDGRIALPDGTIAGSAATMDGLLRNVVRWGCASLGDAVRMLSTVPASVAGAGDRKGRIAAGYDADLVALTPELEVVATWVRGDQAFAAG
jgi:N-acetylglucosamine-6-phosphate deacetylase